MFSSFFSHIYLEPGAANFPLGQKCLEQFPAARLIEINNYKEVFNRPRQDWQLQSQSRKLILAVKPDDFLYPNSSLVSSYGYQHSFYNSQVLNCIYNCSYCYLQGLYPSANIVVFVNSEDFSRAVEQAIVNYKQIYLCISYDTDLLAIEKMLALNRYWIAFARDNPNVLIETRTKSSNFSLLADLQPVENFILAWTLSPDKIQRTKELKTASLSKRLKAIQQAINAGWKVRICLDPVLHFQGWQQEYQGLIEQMAAQLELNKVYDYSIGTFRINQGFLKHMRRQGRSDAVLYYPYEFNQATAGYPGEVPKQLTDFVRNCLFDHGIAAERCVTL